MFGKRLVQLDLSKLSNLKVLQAIILVSLDKREAAEQESAEAEQP